jgi:hypothetical protein
VEATDVKVLMVWDQGINYLLKRGLEKHGVTVTGITRGEYDLFGYTPNEWKVSYGGPRLYFDILRRAWGCDIVHVHSFDRVVPTLKMLGLKVVLHYHGTEIRGRWEDRKKYWEWADAILVSTRDLLMGAPPRARYQPNPIDTEFFHPVKDAPREYGAVHFDYDAADVAELIARVNSLPLTIRKKGVPYTMMPSVLRGYTHYIEAKRDRSDKLLSTRPTDTGSLICLQALACGCTVLSLTGKRKGLPQEHRIEEVARSVFKIYKEVL